MDVALCDILGQHTSKPVCNLLGMRCGCRKRTYNTCLSYGAYRDYNTWREGRTRELTQDLVGQGVTAVKIWPFDQFGTLLGGPIGQRTVTVAIGPVTHAISPENFQKGLHYLEHIRRVVGAKVDIAAEGHARWNLPSAVRISRALEPYDIMWLEEIIPSGNI